MLLTATRAGAVSAWTQLAPPAHSRQVGDAQPSGVLVTMGDWWCTSVGQLIPTTQPAAADTDADKDAGAGQDSSVLHMQWLQPPSRWPYSNRVLQEHDFQAGSVPNMFAAAAPSRRAAAPQQQSQAEGGEAGGGGTTAAGAAAAGGDLFHWVQPGTLAFCAVLSSGQAVVGWATWASQGQLRWHLTPSFPLLPTPATATAQPAAAATILLAADAAVSADGVVVALATQQEPSKVQVVELHGNPLHHACLSAARRAQQPALQTQALAAHSISSTGGASAPASAVLALSWDPHSNGQKLAAVTAAAVDTAGGNSGGGGPSSSGHITLLMLAEQQQQASAVAYTLTPVSVTPTASSAPRPQQCAWLLDGLLAGQQLLDAQTAAPVPVSFPQPAAAAPSGSSLMRPQGSQAQPVLQALAASPHRVCVAMLVVSVADNSGGGSSRVSSQLHLYSIPPVSKAAAGGATGPTLAGRLVWSLLLQLHNWDVVQHVLHAAQQQPKAPRQGAGLPHSSSSSNDDTGDAPSTEAAAAAAGGGNGALLQAQRVAQVLSLVDRKLLVQPDELYNMYALRWDTLKYAVVARTPGGEARAFSIDLRLRLLVQVLELHAHSSQRDVSTKQLQCSVCMYVCI